MNSKIQDGIEDSKETEKLLNETIKKVTEDTENIRLNTAISTMMIFANHMQNSESVSLSAAKRFIQLLAPYAPHIAEELWSRMGETESITMAPWPSVDESKLVSDEVKIIFQVNGKMRGQTMVPQSATQDDVLEIARQEPRVQAQIDGKTIRKVIFVPGKILNIVAN